MKLTFKQRIFFYFFIIFALFTICIIVAEQKEEKKYKTEQLIHQLNSYSDMISKCIDTSKDEEIGKIEGLIKLLPHDIRITLLNEDGKVLYDNDVKDTALLDNHMNRPEIKSAQYQTTGTNIRVSNSTQHEYLYYAKKYPNYFVRVALPYNVETKALLQADNLFIYIVLGLFVVVLLFVNYVASRFGKSIKKLTNFALLVRNDELPTKKIDFPKDELGEIGSELVTIVNQKDKSRLAIEQEREKLLRHFRFAEEGLAVFTANYKKSFVNTLFMRFANILSDKPIVDTNDIFDQEIFNPIVEYLQSKNKEHNHLTTQLNKNGKIFQLQTIVYEDKSFEINIKDITEIEKSRILKQEITSNIAHELRTPVTGLRGYLETLHEQNVPEDKQKQFIEKALQQSIRLSNLIEDISLISKIEEQSSKFTKEKINLQQVINEVRIDLTDKLVKSNIKLTVNVDEDLTIVGNHTLIYSIFANLVDNTINYAGDNVEIMISSRMQNDEFVHIVYYDTGNGVPDGNLNKLFERFYRLGEGRTRNTGGSGLGLSIVRNAVLFHKGVIDVKNRVEGGLIFMFTLKKER